MMAARSSKGPTWLFVIERVACRTACCKTWPSGAARTFATVIAGPAGGITVCLSVPARRSPSCAEGVAPSASRAAGVE
jgi:hypothetical protein